MISIFCLRILFLLFMFVLPAADSGREEQDPQKTEAIRLCRLFSFELARENWMKSVVRAHLWVFPQVTFAAEQEIQHFRYYAISDQVENPSQTYFFLCLLRIFPQVIFEKSQGVRGVQALAVLQKAQFENKTVNEALIVQIHQTKALLMRDRYAVLDLLLHERRNILQNSVISTDVVVLLTALNLENSRLSSLRQSEMNNSRNYSQRKKSRQEKK